MQTTSNTQARIQLAAHQLAFGSVIVMAASMPLSRALFNLASVTLLLGWLASGMFSEKWREIRSIPFAWTHVVFVLAAAFAATYSLATPATTWGQVLIYGKLLLIPVIVSTITSAHQTQRVWQALLLGLGVVLATVYADIWLEIPGTITYNNPTSLNRGVFTHHIVQGMHLALLSVFSLYLAQGSTTRPKMAFWASVALLSASAALLINGSRAGHLALMLGWASVVFFSLRGAHKVLGILVLCAVTVGAYQGSDFFKTRVDAAVSDFTQYRQDQEKTSGGARLAAWEVSGHIWKEQPLFGIGLGAYKQEASPRFKDPTICDLGVCEQPHNQWVLVGTEQGVFGLLALIAMCVSSFFSREGRHPYVIATWACVWAVSLFDSVLLIRHQAFTYLIVLTVVMLVVRHKNESVP
jgi:O-antigen ligase